MAKKNFFVNGVGTGYLIAKDGTLLPLMDMQDMTIEINSTMEQVYGGDALFAIYTYIKEKSAQFTFTNASFSLDMLKISQGATINTGGEVFGDDNILVTAGAGTLTAASGVDVSSVVVVEDVTGKVYSKVASSPSTGQFTVTTGGVMGFATADNGKELKVSYIFTDATAETADILTTSVPGFVELRHKSQPIEQPDGSKVEIHTRVFKARSDGKINIDFKRGNAYAPKMSFVSVDPQRNDKRFVSVVQRNVA